jgi:hypothetical protein
VLGSSDATGGAGEEHRATAGSVYDGQSGTVAANVACTIQDSSSREDEIGIDDPNITPDGESRRTRPAQFSVMKTEFIVERLQG